MPYEVKHIIHSQKRPARSHHESILLDAIEKSIDSIISACDMTLSETVTVRLLIGNQLERVLCVTNDERIFHLLNDPEYKEAKDSTYRLFNDEEGGFYKISNLLESGEDYPLKKEFIRFGFRTRVLIKIDQMGVVAVHSKIDITNPQNLRIVKARVHKFRDTVVKKIKQAWEGKLFGLYHEIDILTSLAQRDEESAFHKILEFICQHHSIFRCAIFVIHQDSESFELLAGYPKETHGTSRGWLAGHPLLQNIVETGSSVHITDLAKDPRTNWLAVQGGVVEKYGITEIAGFPIFSHGEIKAVMTVDYAGKDFYFNPIIDQSFFKSVCHITSNILSMVEKIKRIRLDEDICRIVDQFLHEIRNPITASAGFARRNLGKQKKWFQDPDIFKPVFSNKKAGLKEEDFFEFRNSFQRNTSIIVRESDRVEEILNEFETFVGLRHGKVKINRDPLSLTELARYFEGLFHGLKLSITEELADCELFIDQPCLHQILFNLLKNAFEHTYEMNYKSLVPKPRNFFNKDVFLNISLMNRKNIVFEIINEGFIPNEIKDRVFEPYFSQGTHGGCGLGLPICSEQANLMNGELTFQNLVKDGKKHVAFRLTFPGF